MRLWFALLLVPLFTGLSPVRAAAPISAEAVKAAYLPRFARYISWPDGVLATAPAIQLCVIGSDRFGILLDQAASGETVDGKPLLVRRLSTPAEASGCHLAFVQGRNSSTGDMLAALRGMPILTITDAANGSQRGMIHFAIVNGRVRFSINDADAAATGLRISARLLALALDVRQGAR